jgi:GDP-D-mannose dehydratase
MSSDKTGKVTRQAQKKKHLSPSNRKRNAQRISQWKAKRYEAVEDIKTCVSNLFNR